MPLATLLKEAVQNAVTEETRRWLRDHEKQLTTLIRAAVASAIAEMLVDLPSKEEA